ncbi:SDR family oxidoreductase [Algoriphagus halophytocola]|uniref:SDR family oxidoreductase n=1 Tax=Algoriphagus halophytocola TaxID=2991499 RepID=A0ABY6MJ98_9BACT|nr:MULTISPECIES: SDR family oxidoreductase [unclassified Algoriphagus]UZD23110.1 SDR family oxidoreductase [Algoriphagus sp. TR-M5]WBL44402.1 SDR family oxidoreductase [Algoriphagus sp. TR-M9]
MSNTIFSLEGKKIAFSGATGVLGTSMSKYLAEQGAEVIILGRTSAKVETLVAEITQNQGKAFGYICDVTDEQSVVNAAKEIEKEHGYLDILINAAGGNMPGAVIRPDQELSDLDLDSLRKVIDLNYLGTAIPSKILFPLMLKKGKGNILNISSMAASRPMTRVLGYASAKAAIDNFTKFLSVELCTKHGPEFRVNAIAPGFFLTEQNRALLTEEDGSLTGRGNQIITHTPMNRFGKPEDLLGALHWLCADASAFVTGTIVPVDGGFSAYSGV